MSQIIIPTDQAETPVGDGEKLPFPTGSWQGEICGIHMGDLPPWACAGDAGFASDDGEVLSIELGNNRPLDGQDELGFDRKHFVPFIIRDGDETPETVDVSDRSCKSWKLQQSVRLMTNLAKALGQTEILEDEDGTSLTAVAEDFLTNLKEGLFNGGTEIAFLIAHKPFKDRNGDPKTEVITKEFFGAV